MLIHCVRRHTAASHVDLFDDHDDDFTASFNKKKTLIELCAFELRCIYYLRLATDDV